SLKFLRIVLRETAKACARRSTETFPSRSSSSSIRSDRSGNTATLLLIGASQLAGYSLVHKLLKTIDSPATLEMAPRESPGDASSRGKALLTFLMLVVSAIDRR